ncbi:protein S100-A1-like [Pseudophryne corroboree]|uniref:protein S100-A1-like n=1 Tax=Pseudophryne corroboree TaxID=495146 RepID=UPI003081D83C
MPLRKLVYYLCKILYHTGELQPLLPIYSPEVPTQLESAIQRVISTFHQFASGRDGEDKLNRGELKKLLRYQLGDSIKTMTHASYVNQIMESLDENKDGLVDFREFVTLVANLLVAFNNARQPRA